MKLTLGVFFGGSSTEHEVSVISAVQAMHALNRDKYNVIPVYASKQGLFYTGDALLEVENYRNIPALLQRCTQIAVVRRTRDEVWLTRALPKKFGNNDIAKIDLAFPIVHGTNTEDGSLQGFFETLRLPYVGCDVGSSALGMDKMACKQVLAAAGLPVLPAVTLRHRDFLLDETAVLAKIEAKFSYPVIVKPVNLGSSVGIKVAGDRAALREALDYAGTFAPILLVERAVTGLREINCAVLGDAEEARPSLCEEPITAGEILSYADKYMSSGGGKGMSGARRSLPAEISEEKTAEIRRLAVEAFRAVGCNGVVRIDFILDTDDGDKVYINELNTIPGSLSFYLFAPDGLPYEQLLDRLVELAFKRQREREMLTVSYETNIFDTKQTAGLKGIKGVKGIK